MKHTSDKNKPQVEKEENSSLPVLYPNTAGIDIGSKSHFVAVPTDRDSQPVREFSTFTGDLQKMIEWLKNAAEHIQHMQKALTQMNLHLHNVISDLTGNIVKM